MKKQSILAGAGLIGLAGALGSAAHRNADLEEKIDGKEHTAPVEISEANQSLRNFPEEIPGIRNIDSSYEISDADQTLIVIRDDHYIDLSEKDSLTNNFVLKGEESESLSELINSGIREIYNSTVKVQINVAQAAQFLTDFYENDSLRVEGYDRTPSREFVMRVLYNAKTKAEEVGIDLKERPEALLIAGAPAFLSYRGDVKIESAGSKELYEEALRAKEKYGIDSPEYKQAQERREDFVLSLIDESGEKAAKVVYGSTHNFRDNVDRWNAENPGNEFSLIVLTPYGIR